MANHFYPAVYLAFQALIGKPLQEGTCLKMYLDKKGNVTVGKGNLIDPINRVLDPRLHWLHADGTSASEEDVRSQWQIVKGHRELCGAAGQVFLVQPWNELHLSRTNVDNYVTARIVDFEQVLSRKVPTIFDMPADAQLALLRWAWANGPNGQARVNGIGYGERMFQALKRLSPDFDEAGENGIWEGQGFDQKIIMVQLFQNAADVMRKNLPYDRLVYPRFASVPQARFGAEPVTDSGGSPVKAIAIVGGLGYVGYKAWNLLAKGEFTK